MNSMQVYFTNVLLYTCCVWNEGASVIINEIDFMFMNRLNPTRKSSKPLVDLPAFRRLIFTLNAI